MKVNINGYEIDGSVNEIRELVKRKSYNKSGKPRKKYVMTAKHKANIRKGNLKRK